jgi:trans-2,3-dihydro-3-hydroxyanthranilate isomerase
MIMVTMRTRIVNCFCVAENSALSKNNWACTAAVTGSGNPAAVVLDFIGDHVAKQQLAKKLNLPVTVFISFGVAQNADGSDINGNELAVPPAVPVLEFFYPNTKSSLCLHGALAAAARLFETRHDLVVISHAHEQNNNNIAKLTCVTKDGRRLHFYRYPNNILQVEVGAQEIPEAALRFIAPMNLSLIAKLLGVESEMDFVQNRQHFIDDRFPFTVMSVGSPKLLVPLKSLEVMAALRPDFTMIKEWSAHNKINSLYVYTKETYGAEADFHARGFNPLTGCNEDAATGVAAAALAMALQSNAIVEQGYFINRPCRLEVNYFAPTQILVGGVMHVV